MKRCVVIYALAVWMSGRLSAVAEDNGRTAFGLWKGGSVVYASVQEVENRSDGQTLLKLRPLGVLIGPLDPRTEASIAARAKISSAGTSIQKAPETQSYAIFVLIKKGAEYEVDPFPQAFMPSGTAIEPVKGDPTPVMLKILKTMEELSAKKP